MNTKVTIADVEFKNPVMTASGISIPPGEYAGNGETQRN